MAFKMRGWSGYQSSPIKQRPKKSTESAHGQLNDASADYDRDKRISEDKYWYKIDGKKVSKEAYLEYENVPGNMEKGGKTTNNPDVYGRNKGGSPSNPKK